MPKPQQPTRLLTSAKLSGPLPAGDYMDPTLANFGLRVRSTTRTWFVRVRENGTRVRVGIGPAAVPGRPVNPRALTLKDARTAASTKLGLHADGTILRPRIVLPDAAVNIADLSPATMTVAHLAAAYLDAHAGKWSPSWSEDSRRYVENLILPVWSGRLAKDITRREVKDLVRRYALRAPIAANRLLSVLRKMFRWASREEYLDDAAMVGELDKPTDEFDRDRVLSPVEVRRFWIALNHRARTVLPTSRDRVWVDLWRLRLLTAQREKALRSMHWSWVHFEDKVVEFPARAMKRKKQPTPHLVPLGRLALQVLQRRRALADPTDLLVFGTRTATTKVPHQTSGVPLDLPDFQGKDIRRTASTLMGQHGVSDFDIARVLNHARRKGEVITGIYNRYEYFDEKKRALDLLDRVVTAILHPTRRNRQVVKFKRA